MDWDVQCLKTSECPENVGQLVVQTADPKVLNVCTTFLVDADTIVTNSHCVQDMVNPADLALTAEVVFPQTAASAKEIVALGKVVQDSHKQLIDDPDLAIIHLSVSSARKPLSIDSSGLQDQETLTVYKVNPSLGLEPNYLEQQTCRVVIHPFYLPEFSAANDATVSFTNCEVIHGNSGSPLVGSSGGVKAVVFGFSDPADKTDPALKGALLNLGTNASCLSSQPIAINAASCVIADLPARLQSHQDSLQADLNLAVKNANAEFGKWAALHSDPVVFWPAIDQTGSVIRLHGNAFCVQPPLVPFAVTSTEIPGVPIYEITTHFDTSFRQVNETHPLVEPVKVELNQIQSCGRVMTPSEVTAMYSPNPGVSK